MQQADIRSEGLIGSTGRLFVEPGALDGLTIMRYAHIYRDRASGGVEQYLAQLNKGLVQKHRLTLIQTHLTSDDADTIKVEKIGEGQILWVPVHFRQTQSTLVDLPSRVQYIYRQVLSACRTEGKGQFQALIQSMQTLVRHRGGHLRYKALVLSDHLPELLERYKVDLLVFHRLSYEAGPLILHAIRAKVPFVFINHFDNIQLSIPETQKWITHAVAIGTVSSQCVPANLRDRYFNLSDAVDTEFFSPSKARIDHGWRQKPHTVLLPARIAATKGHSDLLQAARMLVSKNDDFVLGFVGAVDCEAHYQRLQSSATAMGLAERVLFLGEKSAVEMRDCYAMSSVVVLPSYSEGLPRVLLEAQSMKKPVVAYDCGGMREAMLPNETGYLIGKGDVAALAEKIHLLLQNEQERNRFGEVGREFISREFSFAALIERHEACYLTAISGGCGGRDRRPQSVEPTAA